MRPVRLGRKYSQQEINNTISRMTAAGRPPEVAKKRAYQAARQAFRSTHPRRPIPAHLDREE